MLSAAPWQFLPAYFIPDFSDQIIVSPEVCIWKAIHREKQETVVFKAIHKDLISDPMREKEESQVLKDFNQCPNLIKVYDIIYEPTYDWMIYELEYCENGTLDNHLYHSQRQKPLTDKRCLEIIQLVLNGLYYMHNHKEKLLHRDLKPGNIFFCKDGTPKIGDYGLVRSIKWERFVSTAGTPHYKAPDRQYDTRSDIYSVGIILKEMITRIRPSFTEEFKNAIIPNIQINKIVETSTAKNQEERYQSVGKFLEAVKEINL